MSYEGLRETQSGDIGAVRVEGGHIVGCRGPLRGSELAPGCLPRYEYSADDAASVEERSEMEPVSTNDVVVLARSVE